MIIVRITVAIALALGLTGSVAAAADAADFDPKPAPSHCTYVYKDGKPTDATYACLKVATPSDPAGTVVTFSGSLSPSARKNLQDWTKGANDVCLTRYKTTADKDGSWPWQSLDQACTTVRQDGRFTIKVALGARGPYFFGLEMGTCEGSAALCGEGDPGLVGLGARRAVAHTTT